MVKVLDEVAGTLKGNLDWGFWGCGLITEWCFLLPRASLFSATLLPLSFTSIWRTCQRSFELGCLASAGHTSASRSWSAAQSCAKLQSEPVKSTPSQPGAWGLLCFLCFPVRFSAETTGHFSHVPWGAAGPVSTQSAAFSGSCAFPKEGEERDWVLSLAGKTNCSAVFETPFLSRCVWQWLAVTARVENQSCASAGINQKAYS